MAEAFTEVETDKGSDALERRPLLAAARRLRCPVLVAKLDRRSRDVQWYPAQEVLTLALAARRASRERCSRRWPLSGKVGIS